MEDRSRGLSVTFENLIDMVLNGAALLAAFIFTVVFVDRGELTLRSPGVLVPIFMVIVFQSFVFMAFSAYRPIPFTHASSRLWEIVKLNVVCYGMIELCVFLAYEGAARDFMLIWMLVGAVISTAALIFKKNLMIHFTRIFFHGTGGGVRKIIIVGDNTGATADFVKQVSKNPELNMSVIGYVGDKIEGDVGCDKLGSFRELAAILERYRPNSAVFAIDAYDKRHLIRLVNMCDDRCVKVYFLPVMYGFFKGANQIQSVGSLPLINIHTTPLDNPINAFVKRVVDIVGSLALILLTLPIMIAAAIGVKISSPGPIFFRQERVGKMGKRFKMLKFRSMRVNEGSARVWTTGGDPRKTKFGNFIRMTSIDELPQLFNVLIGDMSLVGPRPEIPHFVEYFKNIIPLYMVKHYVKPGLTGLAQVRGLRGDTSVEARIEADIEYIERWSLTMDIGILLKTPFKAFNKQEYYIDPTDESKPEVVALDDTVQLEMSFEDAPASRGKILYAASTMSHLNNFHLGYIDALRKDGYDVRTMARGEGADYNIPFEKKLFSANNTACRVEIKKILANEQFDVIILNTSLAAFHIRRCLDTASRPRVVNLVHGYLFGRGVGLVRRTLLRIAEKSVASRTDSIITMNEADRICAKDGGLCLGEVYFCRGMGARVRESVITPEKLKREHGCHGSFVLCFVGELSARKNQKFLINSFALIKQHIPEAVLWLVGEGDARDSLERRIEELELSDSVMLLGRRDNACDYMRACDLYVSASTIEGMPFNLIEAMGCGKTVLASRVKGHEDLIEDGKSGYLYKLGRKHEFVKRVIEFHNGDLKLETKNVTARYKEFANETVFEETYEIIKKSFVK